MNYLVEQAGLNGSIICDSAGTSSYHIGSPPDARMTLAAQRRGIKLTGEARQLHKSDFENFDLILAMDRDNYQGILYLDREQKYQDKVRLICEFAANHQQQEVPDPYYGGREGFDRVIDLLLDACDGLLQHVVESEQLVARD